MTHQSRVTLRPYLLVVPADSSRLESLVCWIQSSGAPYARNLARRASLPGAEHIADDIVQDASLRAIAMDAREPAEVEFNNEALGRHLLRRAAQDIQRATHRRPQLDPITTEREDEDFDVPVEDARPRAEDLVVDAAYEDALRLELFHAPRPKVSDIAAALSLLTLVFHPLPGSAGLSPRLGEDPGDVPQAWIALHSAGRTDCFPLPGGPDDDALRKRRSRAITAMNRLLQGAVARVTNERGSDV